MAQGDRVILHCDANGFYASVECLDNPALGQAPMAVAGDPEGRHGVILAKNELAKGYGVKTAETVWQARRKCPQLVLVPPRHSRYREISRLVNKIYLQYTSQVEPFGIDESFLDVTGSLALFGLDGEALAHRIRLQVKEQIGITISVGVSFNKVFAKLGSDMKKPDAVTVISRENYRDKVWPLPVSALLFVGGATRQALERHGVNTIGDLAGVDREEAAGWLGKSGEMLWHYARGLDEEPVKEYVQAEPVKSVGNGMTFRRDLLTEEEIRGGVRALTDEVAFRLRRYGLKCRTVQVHIKDPALKTISRQTTLARPTRLQRELYRAAMELIHAHWRPGAPIRALTVTGAGVIPDQEVYEQLSLLDDGQEARRRQERLEEAVCQLRLKLMDPASSPWACPGSDAGHQPHLPRAAEPPRCEGGKEGAPRRKGAGDGPGADQRRPPRRKENEDGPGVNGLRRNGNGGRLRTQRPAPEWE